MTSAMRPNGERALEWGTAPTRVRRPSSDKARLAFYSAPPIPCRLASENRGVLSPSAKKTDRAYRFLRTEMSSTTQELSNKAGNATNGAVGEQTLVNEAATVASHTLDYAKGLVGLGKDKGAQSADDAANSSHGAEGSHTLGGIVSETRDLAAHTLHAVSE